MEPYSTQILIDPYVLYGLIGGLIYLLFKVNKLNKITQALVQAHEMNAGLLSESFEMISHDTEKLQNGLDKLEAQIQYVSEKQDKLS